MRKERKHLISTLKNRRNIILSIKNSGIIVNTLWPFLGASPDGARMCECCRKKLIEVKSMYAKRNLPPQVAAEEKLMFVGDKYIYNNE